MKPQTAKTQTSETKISPEAQILNLQVPPPVEQGSAMAQPSSTPQPPSPVPEAQTSPPPPPHHRRRRSKMLRLPSLLFEEVNQLLEHGKPYAEIIRYADLDLYDITEDILSDWNTNGGHAEWLERKYRDAHLYHDFQSFVDIVLPRNGNKLQEAGLQLAAFQLCKVLENFDPTVLKQKLQDDPKAFLEYLKTLPKLNQADIACETHHLDMLNGWRWEERRKRTFERQRDLENLEEYLREQAAEKRQAEEKRAQAQPTAQPPQPPNPPPAQPPPQT